MTAVVVVFFLCRHSRLLTRRILSERWGEAGEASWLGGKKGAKRIRG